MTDIRTILHPTDLSPGSSGALAVAAQVALKRSARLQVLHVAPPAAPTLSGTAPVTPSPAQTFRVQHPALERLQAEGVPVVASQTRALLPAQAILEYARSLRAGLIVAGMFSSTRYPDRRLGSVATELLHRASTPLLLAPRAGAHQRRGEAAPRVLILIDPRLPNREAVRLGFAWALSENAGVDLVYVRATDLPATARLPGSIVPLPPGEACNAQRHTVLPEAPETALPISFYGFTGDHPAALAQFARKQGTCLIVVATPGLTSTRYCPRAYAVEHMIAGAPCPVLSINPGPAPAASRSTHQRTPAGVFNVQFQEPSWRDQTP
jgi:nucleotide-binding universal stress UspA family protein